MRAWGAAAAGLRQLPAGHEIITGRGVLNSRDTGEKPCCDYNVSCETCGQLMCCKMLVSLS